MGHQTSGSNFTLSLNNPYYVPFILDRTVTITTLGAYVNTAGTTGATIRVGISTLATTPTGNTTTTVASVVLDAGTIAADTTGLKEITSLTTSLTKGTLYWFTIVAQTATCVVQNVGLQFPNSVFPTNPSDTSTASYRSTAGTTTGALPTSGTVYTTNGGPRMFMKVA